MKELGIQKHKIEDLYSYHFGNIRIVDMNLIAEMQQMVNDNPAMTDSLYYKRIGYELVKYGKVFESIHTEGDVVDRYLQVVDLIENIRTNGYKPTWEYEMKKGYPYGAITGIVKDGAIQVVDGHHRLAILWAMGVREVDILVFEQEFWYQDKYPVEAKLDAIEYNWNKKSVLDLGCNVGEVCKYVMNRGASEYNGVDANEMYIQEAKSRNPQMEDSFHLMDAVDGVNKFLQADVVVALGLFHHLSDSAVRDIIKGCNGDLIFEVPTGENEYSEYRVRTKQWYCDLMYGWRVLVLDSGMPVDSSYPFDRLIFYCTKQNG